MRIGLRTTGDPSLRATATPDARRVAPLTRREQEALLHVIERAVRDWPDLALVAEKASRHRGGRAGYPMLHGAARDLLAARDRLRARLGEELRPRGDVDGG